MRKISVFAYENGKMINKTDDYFEKNYQGWWNKIEVGDFNKDGKPDLMVGNWGTNTQLKVSESEPLDMYFKDFDSNGSVEPILCCYIQGKSYPYITRDELLNQINGFRAKYPTYDSYSDVTYQEIFDQIDVSDAGHLTTNHLKTTCFLSNNSGKFKMAELPLQAQYAPVHTITVMDFNHDGNEDVLLCGNNHHN